MSKPAAFMMFAAAVVVGGCATDEASNGDPPSSSSASAVTVGVANVVVANTLELRSTDASNGPMIGPMGHCSPFYVAQVDWNTRMAWGYSYQFSRRGWARVSDGSVVYRSIAGC